MDHSCTYYLHNETGTPTFKKGSSEMRLKYSVCKLLQQSYIILWNILAVFFKTGLFGCLYKTAKIKCIKKCHWLKNSSNQLLLAWDKVACHKVEGS